MKERRFTPERYNPAEFYAQEISKYLASYFERFQRGEIDRETIHREIKNGVEAALQGIEASLSK